MYMQARLALRQLRSIIQELNRNRIPKPPTWTPPERQEVSLCIRHLTVVTTMESMDRMGEDESITPGGR